MYIYIAYAYMYICIHLHDKLKKQTNKNLQNYTIILLTFLGNNFGNYSRIITICNELF